jgi:hypothetical protein
VLEEVRENPNGELGRLREEWRKNLLPEGDDKKSFRSLPLSKSTHLAKRLSERPRL